MDYCPKTDDQISSEVEEQRQLNLASDNKLSAVATLGGGTDTRDSEWCALNDSAWLCDAWRGRQIGQRTLQIAYLLFFQSDFAW